MDGGDGSTAMGMYLLPLNCMLNNGWDDKYSVIYILPMDKLKQRSIM